MGRVKFHCAYCDRSFEDSQEARKRHSKGRNHRENVKLWYDSFADQERKRAAARVDLRTNSEWTPALLNESSLSPQAATASHRDFLPASMLPAPAEAFQYRHRLAEWG